MHPKTGEPERAPVASSPVDQSAAGWPLALTPFEHYYFLDDRPTYPTTFPIELHFRGRLDRAWFEQALRTMIERHPLLAAQADVSQRVPRWYLPAAREPHLEWCDAEVPLNYPAGSQLDLASASGLRTWVRADENAARVVFEIHHACCDGLAGLNAVRDFLMAYRVAAGDAAATAALRPLNAAKLAERGAIVVDAPRPPSTFHALRDAWYTLKVWAAILYRRPQLLAAPARTAGAPRRNPLEFDVATLSQEESAQLRAVSGRHAATVNDLLLRDFLLVLRKWNVERQGARRGRLRLNVPVSVRSRSQADLPAANGIGYGFVAVNARDADDAERCLEAVRAESGRIKDWKLALYFLGGLAFAQRIPGLLAWAMRRRRSFATAVLSNVGRYVADPTSADRDARWTCGPLVLEWIGGVPPVRPLTRAAVIVIDYAGRTSLCLRTDTHYFDAVSARQLLDQFTAQVRQTLQSAG